ncbi:oxaloacetate decarboxylase [Klebsiella grimontii]|uniref:Oxaloacetate decarboxylase n=1 Tax=Klebsiella grimontii TaxID=2058152 RepID=A0A7H4NVS9_9ENTR|nr:oxaloacetate decarboxylase [Klebsiella grimontii]
MTVAITDVVLRDAHQSLFATRLRLDDMLPVAAQLDDVGYGSLECWGGATFDACIRFPRRRPVGPPARAEKGHAEDPAADAAARPEPPRLPPLRR